VKASGWTALGILGSDAFRATVALLLGLALGAPLHAPASLLATAALLLIVSFLVSWGRGPGRLAALGAAAVLVAFGWDSLLGHVGTLTLQVGEAGRNMEETGPSGEPLGLRPLPFEVRVDSIQAGGDVRISCGEASPRRVTASLSAWCQGFSLAAPERSVTGEAALLRVKVVGAGGVREVDLQADRPSRVGDVEMELERYFADFALDERGQPFSRSLESRNPAALLRVRRGGRSWQVFVIRALPEIHRPDGLDLSFDLTGVEPVERARLTVRREPASPLAPLGLLLLGLGLARGKG